MARPSTYNPDKHPALIKQLAEEGKTDAQIAEACGITRKQLQVWRKKYPELGATVKEWKQTADARVERSLYERACGYSHPDVHISNYQGEVTVTPIIKHYPPDPASMIFWLKNRQPKVWRDKQEVNTTVEAGDSLTALIARIRSGNEAR